MQRLLILLAILLTTLGHSVAHACSCATKAPPVAFNEAKAVFIGKVLSGTESWEEKSEQWGHHRYEAGDVRILVEETFKGDLRGVVIVDVVSMKGTSCGDYGLEKGVSYLIYAYGWKEDTTISTGPCTRTQEANDKDAKEDLDFLRNLPPPGTGGILQGQVQVNLGERETSPLPNVKVNIRNGEKLINVARTDSKGHFEVRKLSPGSYTVAPEFPEHYTSEHKTLEVTIEDRGTAMAYFNAYMNGSVLGALVDHDGLGFNHASLDLVERGVEKGKSIRGRSTGTDGTFSFSGVPPGEYILSLELHGQSYQDRKRYYYPGTDDVTEAKNIKVELGGKVEGLQFILPEEFKVRTIQGQVVWEDGKPAANVSVVLHCPRSVKKNGFTLEFSPPHTRTDEEGYFEFEGFTNVMYWLEANGIKIGENPDKAVQMHSAPKKLILVENVKELRLTISEKGFGGDCDRKK